MEVKVYNPEGKEVRTIELPAAIFEAPVRRDLMHQAFIRQMANARLGTHKTKTRSEVRGGGRKPWRQKGTGRARQGSIRAAQWVGGGKVHTPRPRDYSKKMPQKMRQAALRSALTVKANGEAVIVVEGLEFKEPKTSQMATTLEKLVGNATALVLLADKSENQTNISKSTRNLASAKVLQTRYLNVRDLLGYEKIVLPVESLDVISELLGKE